MKLQKLCATSDAPSHWMHFVVYWLAAPTVGLWFRKPIMSSPSASHWNDALHNNNTREKKPTPNAHKRARVYNMISGFRRRVYCLCNYAISNLCTHLQTSKKMVLIKFARALQGLCATPTRRRQLPRHGFGNKVAAYGRAGIVTHAWLLHTRPHTHTTQTTLHLYFIHLLLDDAARPDFACGRDGGGGVVHSSHNRHNMHSCQRPVFWDNWLRDDDTNHIRAGRSGAPESSEAWVRACWYADCIRTHANTFAHLSERAASRARAPSSSASRSV